MSSIQLFLHGHCSLCHSRNTTLLGTTMPIGQLSKHVFELKIIVAISVRSTPVLGRTCENDEFQCIHPDDGCIPYECGTNKKWARRIPEGLI